MPVNGPPRTLAEGVADALLGADGEIAALVREEVGTAILEFPPGTPRITTQGMILDLALSPDGRRLALVETPQRGHDWGPMVILDDEGGEIRFEQEGGRGVAWSPSGREIWFVDKRVQNRLVALTPDGEERVVASFPGQVYLFDIAPDGRVLLATEQRRFEMVGRPPGGEERELTWLSWSVPFDLSGDGRTILFNECSGLTFGCRVLLRGFGEQAPVVLGDDDFGIRLSSDGEWVLSVPPWRPWEIALIATGKEQRRSFAVEAMERISLAIWTPDGQSILFSGNEPGASDRIYRMDAAGGEPRPITPEGIDFGQFAVSPDGTQIAAARVEGGIVLYSLVGRQPRRLDVDEHPIHWSADGRHLYTMVLGEAPATIHRVDLGDGAKEVVASLLPSDPAGVVQVSPVSLSGDASGYVYGYLRRLSELFVVEGLE